MQTVARNCPRIGNCRLQIANNLTAIHSRVHKGSIEPESLANKKKNQSMTQTVFVSGATGFIAQHIVRTLIEKGYSVIGSVRSAAKGDHLAKLLNSPSFSYEVVADVQAEGAFDEALKKHPEVTVFLHTASPFHFKATDIEKELLMPAVRGTENALKAIKEFAPQVTKVVVTSSYAAISTMEYENDPKHVNDESSWNLTTWEESKENAVMGYRGSKKFAEEAAWNFVKNEKPNFTLNCVNPSYVFGPQAFDSEVKDDLNTSLEIINSFLKLTPDSPIPAARGGFADVRDVAKAHLVAFEKPIANERLLLSSERFCAQDVLDVLNEKFPLLRGKIPVGEPGTGHLINDAMCQIVNDKTRSILGFPLMDLKTSVYDSVKQILDAKAEAKI